MFLTDPEHDKTRRECETLKNVVKFFASIVANKEQTAIRAIQQLPADAPAVVCDAVGIKYREYSQYLMTYKTERDLLKVIEQAQVDDTPFLRFCRASLAVNHGTIISAPSQRKPSGPVDPVTAAKMLTGTLRRSPPAVDPEFA
jgi:hypothetical protein